MVVETFLPLYLPLPRMERLSTFIINILLYLPGSMLLTWMLTWTTAYICRQFPTAAMILFGEKAR